MTAGVSADDAWHRMAYAEGLNYCLIWTQEQVRDAEKFDALMNCISGGKTPLRVEILRIDGTEGTVLV